MNYGLPAYIILAQLVAVLEPLAAAHKGIVTAAHDPAEALDLLANAPERWRIVVGIDDEDSAEEAERETGSTGTSRTEFFTIVQAGVGLAAKPGKQVYESRAGGGPSVLELAEAVRCWVRGIRFTHPNIDCQAGFVWQKSTWSTAKADSKPAVYGRQHVFKLIHQISTPADLAPVAIVYPDPEP